MRCGYAFYVGCLLRVCACAWHTSESSSAIVSCIFIFYAFLLPCLFSPPLVPGGAVRAWHSAQKTQRPRLREQSRYETMEGVWDLNGIEGEVEKGERARVGIQRKNTG